MCAKLSSIYSLSRPRANPTDKRVVFSLLQDNLIRTSRWAHLALLLREVQSYYINLDWIMFTVGGKGNALIETRFKENVFVIEEIYTFLLYNFTSIPVTVNIYLINLTKKLS